MVRHDEAHEIMNRLMKVSILQPCEERRMLHNEKPLDPNIVMDMRHKIYKDSLALSLAKNSYIAEKKRLLMEQQTSELYFKREQEFLQKELRKFEDDLCKSRPKFRGLRMCSKKNLASSDDEDFWRTTNRMKDKVQALEIKNKQMSVKEENAEESNIELIKERPSLGNIKVTIKDKSKLESQEERMKLLKITFDILKQYAKEKRRLRDIKLSIQHKVVSKQLQKYFQIWRVYTKNAKNNAKKKKEEIEISDDRKIQIFINEIMKQQKQLKEVSESSKENIADSKNTKYVEHSVKKSCGKIFVVESPAQSRLKAQKEIIEKQKSKLAEQNRIIEELKLRYIQEEISKSSKDTMNTTKDTLMHCGERTRRTLIQFMRHEGYRNTSLMVPQCLPTPPKFLIRMEARAEARRERIRQAEDVRRKKLEEQRVKDETARREEEQEKKKLQQEALYEMKRLREIKRRNRANEIEKCKKSNEIAMKFYRKCLLRHYILIPFMKLIEIRNHNIRKADDHYKINLTRNAFTVWKTETERQRDVKIELVTSIYNRNLLWNIFRYWKELAKDVSKKSQVAKDFNDMKVQDTFFNIWKLYTKKIKIEYVNNERIAQKHYESKLKAHFFKKWQIYMTILEKIKESEKRKNNWREMVKTLIPDFNPEQRGVIFDD